MTPDDFKTWRVGMGLSQAEAAAALGISRASVQLYERGQRHDDGRAVEIPLSIELACESVALRLAAERRKTSLLIGPLRERVKIIAGLIG